MAKKLSVKDYSIAWPLIPAEELNASSVAFPHLDSDGNETKTQILLHKRRVPDAALTGVEKVPVCTECRTYLWKRSPSMPKYALANWLWLGRPPPLLRSANLGHQLLLALDRVVSTKVYLSSKGADETARQQHAETWRQKFLQYGIKGTAIVFGNGNVDEAMLSFPPPEYGL